MAGSIVCDYILIVYSIILYTEYSFMLNVHVLICRPPFPWPGILQVTEDPPGCPQVHYNILCIVPLVSWKI